MLKKRKKRKRTDRTKDYFCDFESQEYEISYPSEKKIYKKPMVGKNELNSLASHFTEVSSNSHFRSL